MEENTKSLFRQIVNSLTGRNNSLLSEAGKNTAAPSLEGFQICKSREVVDEAFENLAQNIRLHTLQPYGSNPKEFERWPTWHWERGRLDPGRRYFYLKAQNQRGWLFERSGAGWVISRCEKIHHQDLFLRAYEPWDIATVYVPANKRSLLGPKWRMTSSSLGPSMMNPQIYYEKLQDAISEDSLRVAS